MPDGQTQDVRAPAPYQAESVPQRFGKWLLMVTPALVPLYTAVPVWADKVGAIYHNYANGSAAESNKQITLASRNLDCLQAPYHYYANSTKISVDGTICRSGDVLIRAVDGQQRQGIYFVSLQQIQNRIDSSAQSLGTAQPASLSLSDGADAAALRPATLVLERAWGEARPALGGDGLGGWRMRPLYVQAVQVQVLSTRPMPGNPRYVIQHIRRPDGCFDQVIDLGNGAVVKITPAPC